MGTENGSSLSPATGVSRRGFGRASLSNSSAPPAPFQIADGTLEALKWLALVLMVMDHVNKWLFGGKLPGVFELGRIVAPTFAFILAYNLTRPRTLELGAFHRVAKRLALYGVLATPPFMALWQGWWPLNICFTLLASVLILYGLLRGTAAWIALAGVMFVGVGLVGEYFYPALLMFLAAWAFCRRPTAIRLIAWIACVASLQVINGNWFALAAVPLLLCAQHIQLRVPRLRHVFYAAYPIHLAALWVAVKIVG